MTDDQAVEAPLPTHPSHCALTALFSLSCEVVSNSEVYIAYPQSPDCALDHSMGFGKEGKQP
jgi:hypothetical protein